MDVTFIMMILDDALYAHDGVHLSFLGQEILLTYYSEVLLDISF
jgi:hypothetical protein